MNPLYEGNKIYADGRIHKFMVTVTTFQDDLFHPMEILSPDDTVIFEGFIQRIGIDERDKSDTSIQVLNVSHKFYKFNKNRTLALVLIFCYTTMRFKVF